MKTLTISWQRLVTPQEETCGRCDATGKAVEQAVATLEKALHPLDIQVVLEKREIDSQTFSGAPAESNRIWIAGQPIEVWLGASVGSSQCCGACGDAGCRTLEVGGEAYEAIPEKLILQAAFAALPHLTHVPA